MKLNSTEFIPLDDLPGWYAIPDVNADCYPLIDLALQLQAPALKKGFYCLCGMKGYERYRVYLAPAKGVRSVLKAFEFGSHGGEDINSAYAQIFAADVQNQLVPYFADGAGLKAKFSKQVLPQLIAQLEEAVLTANP